jgi:MFS family permease
VICGKRSRDLARSVKLDNSAMKPQPNRIDTPLPDPAEVESAELEIDAEGAPAGRLTAFRALSHRNYRLYFSGQLVSLIGTWMQTVAQSWLVLRLTNSAFMLGVVSFASFTPILITGLFAGVVIDRVDRRRLIIVAQILLMLSAFTLAALTWTHAVRVEHVIILAALNGLVSSFDMPGRQAFVVEMVGREDLPNAIALNSMMFNGARAIGPAIAGMLLLGFGEAGCFFLNGLSFLAVIWCLLAMDVPSRATRSMGAAMLTQVREGLHYVWHHEATFYLLLLVAISSGFAVPFTVLVPVFARDLLHGGPRAYGFLLAAQGVGAVCGALVMAASANDSRRLRQNLGFGIFCMAGAVMLFSLSPRLALSMAAELFIGAGLMNYMASTNTLLQIFVSDELRGRVMSIYTLSFIGMAPLGSLEVGFIGEHFSPRVAVFVCGLVALACGCVLMTRMKLIAAEQARREAEDF